MMVIQYTGFYLALSAGPSVRDREGTATTTTRTHIPPHARLYAGASIYPVDTILSTRLSIDLSLSTPPLFLLHSADSRGEVR